ncbi:MAG: hypothetical protein IJG84_06945 [Kiritimatiellae bacterium]|nr:hypothetical protein [Kiritimatiellia bacterium]
MKWIILCITTACLSYVALAFIPKHSPRYYEAQKPEVKHAQRHGAEAKVVYRVVDDEGSPLANQEVGYRWQNDYPRKTWGGCAITDTNGVVILQDKVGSQMTIGVRRKGYYGSGDRIQFFWREGISPLVKDGKWQPYGEQRTLAVKRKKSPVVMTSLHYTSIAVPMTNVWLGIDMESFQWTQPYGNGKHEDMLLRFNYEKHDRYAVQWATMDVSFTNNPYAGFYVLPQDSYSEMKSPYHADTNAVFSQTHTFRHEFFNKYIDAIREGDCMVFRTRTRIDETGNLISAHYGKIYGLWEFADMIRVRDMFFNMTPNDINLEDMKTYKESELREGR